MGRILKRTRRSKDPQDPLAKLRSSIGKHFKIPKRTLVDISSKIIPLGINVHKYPTFEQKKNNLLFFPRDINNNY